MTLKKLQKKSAPAKNNIALKSAASIKKIDGQKALNFWHIFYNRKRAGKVYIVETNSDGSASTPFITVMLNKPMQGKGIGSVAFAMACTLSRLPAVYAMVRKSNIASQKSLEKAGFVPYSKNKAGQDILRWSK